MLNAAKPKSVRAVNNDSSLDHEVPSKVKTVFVSAMVSVPPTTRTSRSGGCGSRVTLIFEGIYCEEVWCVYRVWANHSTQTENIHAEGPQ
eukprot:scaffold184739_cov41-Tisochrysis_lutea.AAC.3